MIFGKPEQKKPDEHDVPSNRTCSTPPRRRQQRQAPIDAVLRQRPHRIGAGAVGSSAVPTTLADAITSLVFDGQSLRIEFGVTRLDEVKPNAPITGRRYTACRLVLPPAAAVDLINRMQQIGTALTQAGVAKTAPGRGQKPPSS